jgi:hypothetical protein
MRTRNSSRLRGLTGAPGRIRTSDPQIRSLVLCSKAIGRSIRKSPPQDWQQIGQRVSLRHSGTECLELVSGDTEPSLSAFIGKVKL